MRRKIEERRRRRDYRDYRECRKRGIKDNDELEEDQPALLEL